jgi:hypothetical protein
VANIKKKEVLVPFMSSKFFIVSNSISCGFGDWGVKYFQLEGKDIEKRNAPPDSV